MANSDNVIRAGLTPKFKDVPTLLRMLTYKTYRPDELRLRGQRRAGKSVFAACTLRLCPNLPFPEWPSPRSMMGISLSLNLRANPSEYVSVEVVRFAGRMGPVIRGVLACGRDRVSM